MSDPSDLQNYLDLWAVMYFRAPELLSRRVGGGPKVDAPPVELWPRIIPTLHAADLIRHELGAPITVNSGYRTPTYNAGLGNVATSQHVQFRALDLSAADLPRLVAIATRILDAFDARGLSTGLGLYNNFVHIDIGAPSTNKRRRWDNRSKK